MLADEAREKELIRRTYSTAHELLGARNDVSEHFCLVIPLLPSSVQPSTPPKSARLFFARQ